MVKNALQNVYGIFLNYFIPNIIDELTDIQQLH